MAYYNYDFYTQYLRSENWQRKRRAVYSRANGICERCRSNPVEATHHITYRNLGDEPLLELMGVCTRCHLVIHGRSSDDPLSDAKPIPPSTPDNT